MGQFQPNIICRVPTSNLFNFVQHRSGGHARQPMLPKERQTKKKDFLLDKKSERNSMCAFHFFIFGSGKNAIQSGKSQGILFWAVSGHHHSTCGKVENCNCKLSITGSSAETHQHICSLKMITFKLINELMHKCFGMQ